MAQTYTRQSTFADGDTITAALFNDEYNQLVNAFAYSSSSASSTGHRHDGTAGQGGNIHTIGDLDFLNKIVVDSTNNRWGFYVEVSSSAVEQIRLQDGALLPVTDSDVDLGTSSLYFKNAYIDSITTTGNVSVGGNLDVTGTIDFSDSAITNVGSIQLDSIAGDADSNTSITFSGSDVITIAAGGDNQVTFTNGAIVPSTDNDIDLGTSSIEFKDAYFDGTVTTDALVADTADINGGTIDGAIIGGSSAAAITGTAITGTSFVIGSADISEAELETIDGVTAGTVAASKAVVVDSNKDIASFRNITLTGELDAGSLDVSGDVDVDGTLETDALSINGTAVTSTAAELNILDGVTSTAAELNILDGVTSTAAELNILDGVTATAAEINALDGITSTVAELNILDGVTANAADINLIDGITNGTVIASKAIITDANKDITGGRNITISGELDAATLDISGDADIDGTLEADAITIGGVTLAETISDTVGAMVTSNTETGVTVTYDDSDNTLDFVIGTLNQDTTGLAATATALATARTIHGVSFDGTANIDLSEVIQDTVGAMVSSNTETNITVTYQDSDGTLDFAFSGSADTTGNAATATALETARTIHGVSFDGTANIDLTEVVQDTVGAMFSSNTESGITVAYEDSDGTIDLTVGTLNQNTTGSAATLTTARTIGGVSFDGSANITPTTFTAATFSGDVNVDSGVLFVDVSENRIGVNQTSPDVSLDLGANTDSIHVPVGTTAQRPGSPAAGYFRYNSTTGGFEGYTDEWGAIAGGGGGTAPVIDTMTGDGSDTTLSLSATPTNENATFVTLDGVLQHKDTYSVSGTTLTFSTAPPTGVKVECITLTTTSISTATTVQDADGDTKIQVEESSDEDKIRFDIAGTEEMVMDASGIIINDGSNDRDFRVESNGNQGMLFVDGGNDRVGVGTSSPSSPLHVSSTLSSDTQSTPETVLKLSATFSSTSSDGAAGSGSRLEFEIPDDETNPITGSAIAGLKENGDDSNAASALAFYISQNDTTLDEAMRIDSNGGVIIGETTAFVNGSNNAGTGSLHVANNNLTVAHLKRSGSNGGIVSFYRGGISSAVGSISVTTSSTAYNTSSDYRLKENVTYEFDALSRVAQLKPARFNFIVEKDETVDGFLAHEVSDIVPEAITGEKDGEEMQSIDQSKLVPLLTKAIQEQQTQIEALQAEINTLKGE